MEITDWLFVEFCKRGCIVETNCRFETDRLPKSLVLYNDNIPFNIFTGSNKQALFRIDAITQSDTVTQSDTDIQSDSKPTAIYFTQMESSVYAAIWYKFGHKIFIFDNNKSAFVSQTIRNYSEVLDELVNYIYTGNLYSGLTFQNLLIPKMINELIESNVILYMRVIGCLPKELQLLIIDVLLGLSKWHNIGIGIY